MLDIDLINENFDKLKSTKRYRRPTPGYFPSAAEIRTFTVADFPYMLEYLLWLESYLSEKEKNENKEGLRALRKAVATKSLSE